MTSCAPQVRNIIGVIVARRHRSPEIEHVNRADDHLFLLIIDNAAPQRCQAAILSKRFPTPIVSRRSAG